MGMLVGAILELYLLVSFPTGGSRFPEGATATVVAVGSCAGLETAGAIPLAIAVGLGWGQVGGLSITWLRQLNGRLLSGTSGHPFSSRRIAVTHLRSVFLDFARGSLVTATGLLLGRNVVGILSVSWPLPSSDSAGLLLIGGAVSIGILLRDMGGYRRHRGWLAAGLALGIIGARLL